jgi:hypothetical protein
MKAEELLPRLSESLTASRVYSEPIERDGIVVVPAAQIRGGGGTSAGRNQQDSAGGGLSARPVGAYVIGNGRVRWKPAVDLTRIIFHGQIIVLTAVLAAAWTLSRRSRAARQPRDARGCLIARDGGNEPQTEPVVACITSNASVAVNPIA